MRIRAQERAEVAAHVHDSVLHTLTLIQRNAEDPREVRRLARAQERELRAWLYRPEGTGKDEDDEPDTLAEAVRAAAAEVEDQHGVPVEVVVVGDCPLDERLARTDAGRARGDGQRRQVRWRGRRRPGLRRGRGPYGLRLGTRPRAPGSTWTRYRTTGWAYENRSSAGCSATAVRPGCVPRPAAARKSNWRWRGWQRHDEAYALDPRLPTGDERRVRVVLVDDHRMFRTGVQAEIGAHRARPGSRSSARPPTSTRRSPSSRRPAPRSSCSTSTCPAAAASRCCAAAPPLMADAEQPVRFLALSVSDAAEDVIGVIRGGARGYVTKTITGTDLVDSIFRVRTATRSSRPRLAGFVLDAFASTDAPPVDEDLDRLTQREREVLRLIARGYAYKEIAKQLFISVKTVESHVSAVLRKLQLSNRHESDAVGDGATAGPEPRPGPVRPRSGARGAPTRRAGGPSRGPRPPGGDRFPCPPWPASRARPYGDQSQASWLRKRATPRYEFGPIPRRSDRCSPTALPAAATPRTC